MSRSYRKVYGYCDRDPVMKKKYNRAIRRNQIFLPSKGNYYRKIFCSYEICDYKFLYFSKAELLEWEYYKDQIWKGINK